MKIAVIGAGITGLAAAYELAKNDIEVDVFEKDSSSGGIAGITYVNNVSLEKYYHHFFKSDKYILELLKELGLSDSLKWLPSSMGFFAGNKIYSFGTPVSLINFKPLSLIEKLRFGLGVVKIMSIKNWKELESITAHEWLIKNVGEKVYTKMWKPLLTSKFGDKYKEIAMSWFWGKLKLRGTSKENGREVLGYIDGSIKLLLDEMEQQLAMRGAKLRQNCEVLSIEKKDKYVLKTSWGEFQYDKIISTVPIPKFLKIAEAVLPAQYIEEKAAIEYTATACTILFLKKQFSKYYWMNIGDESIPFGGLIEHTNLLDKELYGNNNILYISNYLYKDSMYFTMDEKELIKEYSSQLKKINPSFDESWIISSVTFKDLYAQPIIKKNYSQIKPSYNTPLIGLYTASMCSIYPEDRGVNYAVREGKKAALQLMMDS